MAEPLTDEELDKWSQLTKGNAAWYATAMDTLIAEVHRLREENEQLRFGERGVG